MVGAGIFLLLYLVVRVGASAHVPIPRGRAATIDTAPSRLPYYALRSLLRMFAALFFAYVFSLSYAYVAARSRRARRVLIPALDILQSVPVLGFLAVTVTFFLALFRGSGLGLEAASVFAVFTSQAWNITFADELELVDAPPAVLADRARRGELGPGAGTGQALQTSYAPQTLAALREQAFSIVTEHTERRQARYRGDLTASGQAPPVILACVPPEPGMEPLIRSAAALAARLAGQLTSAAVIPAAAPPGLDHLLAGYAALAAQLGGEFAVLPGSPAAALSTFAQLHQVTEMLLARSTARTGRHPVLRELVQRAGRAEVHVLPAERPGSAVTAARVNRAGSCLESVSDPGRVTRAGQDHNYVRP